MEATIGYEVSKPQTYKVKQPKWQRIILLSILGYEAAGGIAGGILLSIAPDGHLMDMPVDILHGAFSDFLIPGIILLGMGILTAFSVVSVFLRTAADWLIAAIALCGWIIWFTVEIAILKELHWLHLMWGFPIFIGIVAAIPLVTIRNVSIQNALLTCGILSSIWYVAINIYVPMQDPSHSMIMQVVSELSAIGAPTRILWVLLATLYPILYCAFGWGVAESAANNRALKAIGPLIIIYSVITFYWPPMHMRGSEMTLTDVLHIIWGMITVIFMIANMAFGMTAFGKGFRIYTIISLVMFLATGVLIGFESVNLAANQPTPLIGVWERINIGIYMLWIAMLAIMIMRKENISPSAKSIH